MHPYIILVAAIVFEVSGTLLLPLSQQFTQLIPSIILLLLYSLSFYCLSLIANTLPLVILYSSWAGLGIFTTALLSYFFYNQSLNWQSILGLFLIVIGVTLVNLYKTI